MSVSYICVHQSLPIFQQADGQNMNRKLWILRSAHKLPKVGVSLSRTSQGDHFLIDGLDTSLHLVGYLPNRCLWRETLKSIREIFRSIMEAEREEESVMGEVLPWNQLIRIWFCLATDAPKLWTSRFPIYFMSPLSQMLWFTSFSSYFQWFSIGIAVIYQFFQIFVVFFFEFAAIY